MVTSEKAKGKRAKKEKKGKAEQEADDREMAKIAPSLVDDGKKTVKTKEKKGKKERGQKADLL
jgi:hypothetical protein